MNKAQEAYQVICVQGHRGVVMNRLITELKETGEYDEFVALAQAGEKAKAEAKAKEEAETAKIIAAAAKRPRHSAMYNDLQSEGHGEW